MCCEGIGEGGFLEACGNLADVEKYYKEVVVNSVEGEGEGEGGTEY